MSGQALDRDKSRSDRIVRLKNSLAQDIVYSVSNVAIKVHTNLHVSLLYIPLMIRIADDVEMNHGP